MVEQPIFQSIYTDASLRIDAGINATNEVLVGSADKIRDMLSEETGDPRHKLSRIAAGYDQKDYVPRMKIYIHMLLQVMEMLGATKIDEAGYLLEKKLEEGHLDYGRMVYNIATRVVPLDINARKQAAKESFDLVIQAAQKLNHYLKLSENDVDLIRLYGDVDPATLKLDRRPLLSKKEYLEMEQLLCDQKALMENKTSYEYYELSRRLGLLTGGMDVTDKKRGQLEEQLAGLRRLVLSLRRDIQDPTRSN